MPTDLTYEISRLNLLTELGIISDHIVVSEDIAKTDAAFAVEMLGSIMTTAEIPVYTVQQYNDAKAVSDALLEAITTNAALGLPQDATLDSEFSRALRKTRFYKRMLDYQKQYAAGK